MSKQFSPHPPVDRMKMFDEWKRMVDEIERLQQENNKIKEEIDDLYTVIGTEMRNHENQA